MTSKYNLNNIILIDDDEVSNYIARDVLENMGITENIIVFESAIIALEFISKQSEQSENLIFLDVNMPYMNGFDFLDAYHEFLDGKKGAVIAMFISNSLNGGDRIKAQKYGKSIAKFIEKPLTSDKINDLLEFFQKSKKKVKNGIKQQIT